MMTIPNPADLTPVGSRTTYGERIANYKQRATEARQAGDDTLAEQLEHDAACEQETSELHHARLVEHARITARPPDWWLDLNTDASGQTITDADDCL